MRFPKHVHLAAFVLCFAASACDLPLFPAQDTDVISTSAAQTVIARFTQSAVPVTSPPTNPVLETPASTSTPEPPTLTPTITLTPTPIFTVTPLIPFISVSVPTNCRVGPGKVYEMTGALLVGETAQILARDPTGRYWYIRNPDSSFGYCWVWGEYATISGYTGSLPVYTPPPTPTPTLTPTPSPDFEFSYASLDTCSGSWWVEFKVRNTGSVLFRSAGITVKDTVTDVTLSTLTDGFVDINGCLTSTTRDSLAPDKAAIISAPGFTYNPTGNRINATVTLCSNTGQNGTCVTRTIKFTP